MCFNVESVSWCGDPVVWKMKIRKTSKVKDDRSLSIQSRIIIRKASKDLWAFASRFSSCSFLFFFEHVLAAFKFARVPRPSRALRIFRILINVVLFCWRQQPGRRTYRRLVLLKLHKIDSQVQLRVLRNYVAEFLSWKNGPSLCVTVFFEGPHFVNNTKVFSHVGRQLSGVISHRFRPLSTCPFNCTECPNNNGHHLYLKNRLSTSYKQIIRFSL